MNSSSHLLHTSRFLLRPLETADLQALHALMIHPEIRRFLWDDVVISQEKVEAIIQESQALFQDHGFGLWMVCPLQHNNIIGFAGYWYFHEPPQLELLYGLHPDYWHCGAATEMSRAVLEYGFEVLHFNGVQASCNAPHAASIRVMERLGMTFHKQSTEQGQETVYYELHHKDFYAKGGS